MVWQVPSSDVPASAPPEDPTAEIDAAIAANNVIIGAGIGAAIDANNAVILGAVTAAISAYATGRYRGRGNNDAMLAVVTPADGDTFINNDLGGALCYYVGGIWNMLLKEE